MTFLVQTFTCPRCNRGEFRALPGVDGKAHCPWCGDAVSGGVAAPPTPAPEPAPAVVAPPATPEPDGPLRERLTELTQRHERTSAELREELEKKEGIKRAVAAELGRLTSQLGEAKAQLQKRDEELERERKKGVDVPQLRESLAEAEKRLRVLEAELAERRASARGLEEARDLARRDLEQLRGEQAKQKAAVEADLADQRKKLAALEARLGGVKQLEAELADVKAKGQDYRRRLEKEQKEFQQKVAGLQGELDKRDQRIRDLQLLIKTLGERLNDLTNRRP